MADPDRPQGSTERRLLSSSIAAFASNTGRTLIRVAAERVLAQLLLPSTHGLFDTAFGIVILSGAIRDLGLVHQVVRDDRQPYGTVLTWVSSTGLLLSTTLVVVAPLFASKDPLLPGVIRAMAFYVLLDGLAAVPKVYFERQLAVRKLMVPELLRGSLFATLSIVLAWQGFGVTAFVVAELAGAALFAILVWRLAWGKIPLALRLDLLPDLLRRSYLLALVWFATAAIPLVGRYVIRDSAGVGLYTKAHLWALRLHAFILPALARVLYPALVEYRREPRRFVAAFRLGTLTIAACEVLGAYFLFFNAEVVFLKVLLGPGWEAAVPLLRTLAFVPLVDALNRLGGEVLKVHHEDRFWLAVVLVNLSCLVGFGTTFTLLWGTQGMAVANFFLLGNLIMAWRLRRICGRELYRLLFELAVTFLIPLPFFLAAATLPPDWGRFVASLAAAALSAAVLGWRLRQPWRGLFRSSSETP